MKKTRRIDEGEQKGDEGLAGLTARPKSFMLPHYNKHGDDTEVESRVGNYFIIKHGAEINNNNKRSV